MPTDPAGIVGILDLSVTPNGLFYAYDYVRILSSLYVAHGIR